MNGIHVKDVTFYYNQNKQHAILRSLSLSIDKGKIVGITGKSGCGKSTLFSLLAGIYPEYAGVLDQGTIQYDGKIITDIPIKNRAKIVSLMFQNPDLQFCMDTVENELIFCLENIQIPTEEILNRIDQALQFCTIHHLRNRKLETLSGGEKQLVSLSCIVALDSDYLLLDEPFANIDTHTAKILWEKLIRLNRKKGKTIVLIDHHLNTPGSRVDQWIILNKEQKNTQSISYFSENREQLKWFDKQGITVHGYSSIDSENRKKKTIISDKRIFNLENVTIKKGDKSILENITLSIPENAITVLTGKSGSGKSTLLASLAKMTSYQGEIYYKNKALKKWKTRQYAKKVGMIFQNPQDQFIALTVFDEIKISLSARVAQEEMEQEIKRYLSAIQLWQYRDFSPYMLSQGQQRRLAVAVLLAHECDVLLCDEPTYGQDKENIEAIMNLLLDWMDHNQLTVILSTHDLLLAKEYADFRIECKNKIVEVFEGDCEYD